MNMTTIDPDDIVIESQLPIAVYEDEYGSIAIWQAGDQLCDEKIIRINRVNLRSLIEAMNCHLDMGKE